MKAVHMVSFVLLIIGGLNWGLTALGWNVVHMILGGVPAVENLVYLLVGLAAIVEAVKHKSSCKMCVSSSAPAM